MSFEFFKKNKLRKSIIGITLLVVVILSVVLNWKPKERNDSPREWHTKQYLAAVLTEKNDVNNISDPDLKNLLSEQPELPASWLKKIDMSKAQMSVEDGAGNKLRSVLFRLVDGGIAWNYFLTYNADGTFCCSREERCDAKDYDPKYQDILREVDQKAREEMERKNIKGLASCYAFWDLKKKYLKAEGIDWKSPTDLNPSTCYD